MSTNQRCQERTDPFQQNGAEYVSRDGKLLPKVAEQHRSHCKASLLAASGEKPVQVEQRMRRSLQQNKGNGGVRQSADPLRPKPPCEASMRRLSIWDWSCFIPRDKHRRRPIAYASRTLNKAEENYSQLDKEALAIVWAVKKFFHYLCGRKFTLITDHQPLKFIFNPSKGIPAMSAARQQRYAIFLSGFNYDIEYRNSQAHANADGLSRLPLPSTASFADDEVAGALFYSEVLETMPVSVTDTARESRRDPLISEIMNYVEHDHWPHEVSTNLQPFSTRRHEMSVQQGCILWGRRLIVPAKIRKDILSSLHMGHLGVV